MKTAPLAILALSLLCSAVKATTDIVVELVTIPIYHPWEEAEVRFVEIPCVGWDLDPFRCAPFYSRPFGEVEGMKTDPVSQDLNLISVYKIEVEATEADEDERHTFSIDTSSAKKAEGYDFTVAEVAQMAAKSIRMDYPDREKVVIQIDGKPAKVPKKP